MAICCALAFAADQGAGSERKDVNEEMHLINKSLEGLLNELALIKREATGRLSQVKNRVSAGSDPEHIRQTKVSRFVLKRVAELEGESLGMRDEMSKLFELQRKTQQAKPTMSPPEVRQEDHDFEEPALSQSPSSTTTTTTIPTTTVAQQQGLPQTTTLKPEEEAAAIGFDLEALKKLGEEIGKRLDQFGKDAAKNLSDLLEGVKLVFREPNKSNATSTI